MSQAILQTFDGSKQVSFLVAPAETSETHTANFAKLPVLNTPNPLVKYNYSISTISFPDLKVLSPGNKKDLRQLLDTLKLWTKPDPDQKVPRLLKFTWGTYTYPRVYLAEAKVKVVRRTKEGVPIEARVDLELLPAPEVPKPVITDTKPRLSEREQKEYADKARDAIKGNKDLMAKVGGNAGLASVSVSEDGQVSYTDPASKKSSKLGSLKDIGVKLPGSLSGL